MLYNAAKLVRDKIPEIIKKEGNKCNVFVLKDDEDYKKAIKNKILEESEELFSANNKETKMEELADLYEILDAFCNAEDIDKEEVKKIKKKKTEERGAFKKRIFLVTYEK